MPSFSRLFQILQVALLEDWLLKFICLGLAILMWFYIDGELTDQNDFVVAMRQRDIDLPHGWTLAPERPLPKFTVRVRGPRRRVQLLNPDRIAFNRQVINNPRPGPNILEIKPADLIAEGFDILNVAPKDDLQATIHLSPAIPHAKSADPVYSEPVTKRMTLEVWPVAPAGAAMTVEPKFIEVEVEADAAEFSSSNLPSKIIVYAKWPASWERPNDAATVLGPATVPVQVAAPSGVKVQGIDGAPLPSVTVRGALAAPFVKE